MNKKRIWSAGLSLLLAWGLLAGATAHAASVQEAVSLPQQAGLKAEYYVTSGNSGTYDFGVLKSTVIDPNIDFNDLEPALQALTGQHDYNTVRWTGQITPSYSEDYTFYMIGDNGFRLWIDGSLMIDHWVDDWEKPQTSTPVKLEAGKSYDFKVEFFEHIGGSNLHLSWSSASQPKQIVPAAAFTLPLGYANPGPLSGSISEDGKQAELKFDRELGPLPDGAAQHIKLNIGNTEDWPIASAALKDGDHSVIVLQFKDPIYSRDANVVRAVYDGGVPWTYADGETIAAFTSLVINHSEYQLETPWASQLDKENVLPEYPRPQMTRSKWMSLNGEWEFASAKDSDALPTGKTLGEKIVVPFAVQSKLSGIGRNEERMWYKRSFTVPADWSGERVLVNFGAVDWEATVYVNGQRAGTHTGGYSAFSFDITDKLKAGDNELIVKVYDPTDNGDQPIGKQRNNPSGIWYTAVSGIWQTVWLEPVPSAHIDRLDMTPDINAKTLRLTVRASNADGATVRATAYKDGKEAGSAEGIAGSEISIPVPDPRLWSPSDPFLYDLKVELKGTNGKDEVSGYFGMREIKIGMENGVMRPLLNGKFVFQYGPLDQGYWPDGIYTAPTDEALKFDIQTVKDLGMNMIRKHMKVEPDRWYYWADKLGILVWQDMPSIFYHEPLTAQAKQQFETEMKEMIDQHRSTTSIIEWTVFNEGWGQFDQTGQETDMVKALDPTRLINNASGWTDRGNGDLIDMHNYVGPGSPNPTLTRAAVLGEFGGLGLRVQGHEWSPNVFNYELQGSVGQLTDRYVGLVNRLKQLIQDPGLSAAVYTQLTDVEYEINGLLSYDRKVQKLDFDRVRQAHKELLGTLDAVDLQKAIDEANAVVAGADVGSQAGQYPQSALDQLKAAVAAATAVLQNGSAAADEIAAAVRVLDEAVTAFNDKMNPPIPQGADVDSFDSSKLNDEWSIVQPVAANWSLSDNPGHLRIKALNGDIYQTSNDLKNIFLKDAPTGDFEITAKVTAPVRHNFQQAGLLIWQDADNYVRLGHVWDSTVSASGYSLETAKETKAVYTKAAHMAPHPQTDTVYLKIRKVGNQYTTFYWSGAGWIQASDPLTSDIRAAKIGFYSLGETMNADFDYITVQPVVSGSLQSVTLGASTDSAAPGDTITVTVGIAGMATATHAGLFAAGEPSPSVAESVYAAIATPDVDPAAGGVYAADITVAYDSTLFHLQDAAAVRDGFDIIGEDTSTPGRIRLLLASQGPGSALKADADIVKLRFVAAGEVPASGRIEVSQAIVSDGAGHQTTLANAAITIAIRIGADLDGDGVVTFADLDIMARYYGIRSGHAQWADAKRADLNADGIIDIADLTLAARSLIH